MSVQPVGVFSNFKTNFNTAKLSVTSKQQAQNNNAASNTLDALTFRGNNYAATVKKHEASDGIEFTLNNINSTKQIAYALVESVQQQADEAVKYSQKLFDEVTELFKKGDEIAPDGTVLRRITGNGPKKVMEEYAQDGTLKRVSIFIDGTLEMVDEGIIKYADGTKEIAKRINFENKKLENYKEGIIEYADETGKIAKELSIWNGKPTFYMEGIEKPTDAVIRTAKQIGIAGRRFSYVEGHEVFNDESEKIAKRLDFTNGEPTLYHEGFEIYIDAPCKIAKEIYFTHGNPTTYRKGVKELTDGSFKAAKQFKLTDKGWQEVTK